MGPYFFDSTVNASNYLNMLQQFFFPENKKQKLYGSYYFQQDRAPAHSAKTFQTWWEVQFGPKFVKKDIWPPRSSDLNPCDFFFWGYFKDRVYSKRLESNEPLKVENDNEISIISKITLWAVLKIWKKVAN